MGFRERQEGIEFLFDSGVADMETLQKYSDSQIHKAIEKIYPGGYEEYILDCFD